MGKTNLMMDNRLFQWGGRRSKFFGNREGDSQPLLKMVGPQWKNNLKERIWNVLPRGSPPWSDLSSNGDKDGEFDF